MTHKDKVLAFLRTIVPKAATNSEIEAHTGIKPHQQVFQITRSLLQEGRIGGVKSGHEWYFHAVDRDALENGPAKTSAMSDKLDSRGFEAPAQKVMSAHYRADLRPGQVSGVHKLFDLVSADHSIVGDAKYLTLVGGERLPPAKFSGIAEHVWLLEKTAAQCKFLVFGNDRRVPMSWLHRYGRLLSGVEFYFLEASGRLDCLAPR